MTRPTSHPLTQRHQAKEDATELLEKKVALEKEKKDLDAAATAVEVTLAKKLGAIGNIVHDSVPVSNNEVCALDAG